APRWLSRTLVCLLLAFVVAYSVDQLRAVRAERSRWSEGSPLLHAFYPAANYLEANTDPSEGVTYIGEEEIVAFLSGRLQPNLFYPGWNDPYATIPLTTGTIVTFDKGQPGLREKKE